MPIKQIEISMPWGYIKGQIFGQIEGKSQTPILCLHGYLDNSNSFKPLVKYLCATKEYYMIALDLPGHGLSSKISEPLLFNFRTYIFSVRKTVEFLNLKTFVFLTHSFGCTLGLMVRFNFFLP